MAISVTHYTRGTATPSCRNPGERLTLEAALADMFSRLRAGAALATSGYNYGLIVYAGPDEAPTGSDTVIYGGIGTGMQDFLIRASKWWEYNKTAMPGTPEHEDLMRWLLLEVIGYTLSDAELATALSLVESEFLLAVVLADESGEHIGGLFQPSATH